jgi:hypothetical protein
LLRSDVPTDAASIDFGPPVDLLSIQIDYAHRGCAKRPFGLGGMPDRGINAPCDYVCLDKDGCSMRGRSTKELEAILHGQSQRAAPVVM